MAEVGEWAQNLAWSSAMPSQTSCWFDTGAPHMARDSCTDRVFRARALSAMTLPDSLKTLEAYDQRPCSVQLTGILVSEASLTRIEVLRTRFCFAPASSSPSIRRTGLWP